MAPRAKSGRESPQCPSISARSGSRRRGRVEGGWTFRLPCASLSVFSFRATPPSLGGAPPRAPPLPRSPPRPRWPGGPSPRRQTPSLPFPGCCLPIGDFERGKMPRKHSQEFSTARAASKRAGRSRRSPPCHVFAPEVVEYITAKEGWAAPELVLRVLDREEGRETPHPPKPLPKMV